MIDRNRNNFKSRFLSIRTNSLSRNGKNIRLDNNVSRFITYHIRIQPLRNLLSLIEIGGEFPDFFRFVQLDIAKERVVVEKAISGSGDQGTYPVKVCINDVLSVSLDSIVFPFTDQIKRKPFHYTVWSSRNRRGVSRNRTITLRGDKKEEEEKMIRSFKPISHLKLCRKTIFSVTSCDNFPRFRNAPFFRPFHIVVLFHNVFFPSSLHDVCSCHGIISPAVYSAFRIQKRIQSGVETGQELSSTARNEGKVGRSEGFPLDGQLGA